MFDPRHIIVLMLENRSFDHMLGFLPHPDQTFQGLQNGASNPAVTPPGTLVAANPSAAKSIDVDPGHGHDDVIEQLTGSRTRPAGPSTNSGFVMNYERQAEKRAGKGAGARIMACHAPGSVPVLSTLATEFAVFDHWFCSVPGATWPNRNFAFSGTSDGQVDIKLRFYRNDTVFERLEQTGAEQPWRVYHDGIPQVWAFINLLKGGRKRSFASVSTLLHDIAADQLPKFAFVEPSHFGRDSCSQHPSNNTPKWYRNNPGRDFDAAERLIASIYEQLASHPPVFNKTLFLITYDEHGGFFDHVPPPRDGKWEVDTSDYYQRDAYTFRFDSLGPRVPTVLVSPYISRGTLVNEPFEHSSIAGTVRRRFAPETAPLSPREAHAARFDMLQVLDAPRRANDLPRFSMDTLAPLVPNNLHDIPASELDDFQRSVVHLGQSVRDALIDEQRVIGGPIGSTIWWEPAVKLEPQITTIAEADSYQRYVVDLVRTMP